MKDYPQYNPNDVKIWLTKVFGEDIIFDTQAAADDKKHRKEESNPLGAWGLFSAGELYLRADLPPEGHQLLVASLRYNLENAMCVALVPEYWKAPMSERKKAVRESGWPLPEDVIRNNLYIDTALLKNLAMRMKKPAEYTGAFAKAVQETEAVWIERKEKLTRRCAVAFIGREPGEDIGWHFRYSGARGGSDWLEVAFLLPEAWPPVFPGECTAGQERAQARVWENHWNKRSHELGLAGAFRYSDFSIGTHGSIDEQKLVLDGCSDMDISNKMDALLGPENLPNVQTYFNEVLGTTLTKIWLGSYHPDFRSDFARVSGRVQNEGGADTIELKKKVLAKLKKSEKYDKWANVVPELIKAHPTTGAFIEALHGAPPRGQEKVYETLRQWARYTFPLLTKAITDRKLTPIPVSAPQGPRASC